MNQAVVVVERDELAQAERAGERTRFVRDTLHQAAVTQEYVRVMIDDRMARLIEFAREQRFGERHADRVGEPLTERARRRFDAGRDADLRMSGRLRMQLAEVAELADRQVVAGQMQQRVLQHRAVAVRKYETIAIRPMRIGGVVAQVPVPQRDRDLGHAHRHARMSRLGRLDCVHRQSAYRICKFNVGGACGRGCGHGSIGGTTRRKMDAARGRRAPLCGTTGNYRCRSIIVQ